MKRNTPLLFVILSVLLLGCVERSGPDERIDHAEKLVAEHPDSALALLRTIHPEKKELQARRTLLYAEAIDRSASSEECDSALIEAAEYYRKLPREQLNMCRALYHLGMGRLRKGDKPAALRIFLEVEETLRKIDDPHYLGLLYLRIGAVYRAELNFTRAYRYYKEARDLFARSKDSTRTVEALLGMTASALRMHDLTRAQRCCSLACELADESHDKELQKRCLAYFATLHVLTDTTPPSETLLKRIENSVWQDTTSAGYCTLAQVEMLRNRTDMACRHIEMALKQASRCEEIPMLLYTAYRIDLRSGNYKRAAQRINRFIALNDSLTRAALQNSAGMIEKEFFRERAAFYDYRLANRRKHEWELAVAAVVLLGIAGYIVRQRMRLQKERNERLLLLVREIQTEYGGLSELMESKHLDEARLKGMIASRFAIVDQLGKTLYERENTAAGQTMIVRQVKELIDGFSENGAMLQELETIVNMAHDDIMVQLRLEFPQMKENDIRMLCYIFGGFSPQVISLFMHNSVANIYARKSRIKARIKASDTPNRDRFVALLE